MKRVSKNQKQLQLGLIHFADGLEEHSTQNSQFHVLHVIASNQYQKILNHMIFFSNALSSQQCQSSWVLAVLSATNTHSHNHRQNF